MFQRFGSLIMPFSNHFMALYSELDKSLYCCCIYHRTHSCLVRPNVWLDSCSIIFSERCKDLLPIIEQHINPEFMLLMTCPYGIYSSVCVSSQGSVCSGPKLEVSAFRLDFRDSNPVFLKSSGHQVLTSSS